MVRRPTRERPRCPSPDVSTAGKIVFLEAIYAVQSGKRSFTALIRGGQDNETNRAILDGVILSGWRTGAPVHVEFDVIGSCAGKPQGPCFKGTISISRDSKD